MALVALLSACGSGADGLHSSGFDLDGDGAETESVRVLEAELTEGLTELEGPWRPAFERDWTGAAAVIAPCTVGSDAYAAADTRLEELDATIRFADRWGSVEPLSDQLRELLRDGCVATTRDLPTWFASVSSMQQFWRSSGYDSVRTALDVEQQPMWLAPAAIRRSVDELDPVFPGLFSACDHEGDCADETAWKAELSEALHVAGLETTLARLHDEPSAIPTAARCADAALAAPEDRRLEAWQACIGEPLVEEPLLPVGNLRIPDAGWLHVGVEPFLDDTTYIAVDLDTGATMTREVARFACAVDEDGCERERTAASSPSNARSARRLLWLLLAEKLAVFGAPEHQVLPIPEGVEPLVPQRLVMWGGCGGACAVLQQLTWAYVSAEGVTVAAGRRDTCRRPREAFQPFTDRILETNRSVLAAASPGVRRPHPPPVVSTELRDDWGLDAVPAIFRR